MALTSEKIAEAVLYFVLLVASDVSGLCIVMTRNNTTLPESATKWEYSYTKLIEVHLLLKERHNLECEKPTLEHFLPVVNR